MLTPNQATAVVLAGGLGTRVHHLLPNLPKPMASVAGKPFLEWVVRYLARQNIRRVILSTGYLAETVERHFATQPVKTVVVRCVRETKPLGTAGGFLKAISVIKVREMPEACLVLNGDSLTLTPLNEMFQSLDEPKVEGAILGVHADDASRFGTISQNARGELTGFNEKKPSAGIINAGVYLLTTNAIELFPIRTPLSFETEVFPALIARGIRLKVCVTAAPFLDIGTPESLPLAEALIRRSANCFEDAH